MTGSKVLKLGLIAAVVAAAASAGILASTAFAQGPGVGVSSGTAEPGGEGTVTVTASEIAAPGLAAWTLSVAYPDSAVATLGSDIFDSDNDTVADSPCAPGVYDTADAEWDIPGTNLCNPEYDSDLDTVPDSIRIAGASPFGETGDTVLATINFLCADTEATADLVLTVQTFADSGPAPTPPADISVTPTDGTFACAVQPTATGTTAAAATATIGQISGTGTGDPMDSESNLGWVIAALAGAGLAAFAGLGALRLRSRRA